MTENDKKMTEKTRMAYKYSYHIIQHLYSLSFVFFWVQESIEPTNKKLDDIYAEITWLDLNLSSASSKHLTIWINIFKIRPIQLLVKLPLNFHW